MKTYELMIIVRSDFPVADEVKRDALLTQVVKHAKVTGVEVLGKRKLTYPIQKQNDGIYMVVALESEGLHAADIEREAKMGTEVLRFILIQKKDGK